MNAWVDELICFNVSHSLFDNSAHLSDNIFACFSRTVLSMSAPVSSHPHLQSALSRSCATDLSTA